ncbi:ATP-binding protein [Ilumatobacter sp.]|uniref:ATP-binding protein n=1 Tax=Ilumatobacter sp. TaxID=1967498 RepID=UPI0037530478
MVDTVEIASRSGPSRPEGPRRTFHPTSRCERTHAPDLLATARAQRWEPVETLRALLTEELTGRQASSIRTRMNTAGFPTGKTFDTWNQAVSSVPEPTARSLQTLEWIERHKNLVVAGRSRN